MTHIEIAIRVGGDRTEAEDLTNAVADAVCPHDKRNHPCGKRLATLDDPEAWRD